MNLSKKLKYLVLLPIIAFMAVAIALCACIGIKGADVGTTAEAASHTSDRTYNKSLVYTRLTDTTATMTITPTEQSGHTHDGMYFETDLNASFAVNQNLSDVTYVTNSYFPGIQIIKYGVIEVDSGTGDIISTIEKPSVTGLVLYEEWYKTSRAIGDGSGTKEYYVTQKYHYDISGGTYYLSEDLDFSQNYVNSLPIYVNGTATICLNGHTLTLLEDTQFEVMSGGITLCGCDSDGDGVRGNVITSAKKLIYSNVIYRITVSLQNVDIECQTNFSYWSRYHYMMIAIQCGDFNMSNVNFTYTGTKDSDLDKIVFLDIASFKEFDTELNNASVGENVSVDSNFYFRTGPAINMNGYNNSDPIFVQPREIRVGTVIAENATDDMVEIYNCGSYVDLERGTDVVAIIPWGIEVTLNNVSLDAVDGGGALSQTDLRDVAMTTIYLKANDGYQLPISLALPSGLVYTVSEDKLTATISGKPTDDQVQSYNGTPIAVTVNGKEYVEPHIHDGITFDLVMDADLLGSLGTGWDETTSKEYKILTAGNYFLNSGHVSLTADIRIFGQVNICLNGNNIVCGEYRFVLAGNASLNIYGCNGGAFVKDGYSIFADNAGTSLGVHGGNAGRIVTVNPIDVSGYTGTVNVMFRNLTSGTTVLTNGTQGNLSLINAGSFDIREEGGNVVVYVYGSVTITLVDIELVDGNTGALVQTNLLGAMTPVIVKAIDGKFLPDRVSTKNGIVYTNNGDGTATISGTPSGDVSYALAAFDSADGHVHDEVTFGTALTLEYLNDCAGYIEAGDYYLAEDITWYGSLYINDGVNICLNGNKFRYACTGDRIYVGSTGTLGIYGCCGGELTNSDNFYQYLFYVEGGKFNLFGGTVSSTREKVINLTNGASFTMTGGSVINNYTSTEYINIEQQVSVYANSGSAVKITNGTVKGKLYVWDAIELDGYVGEAIPLYNGNITTGCVLANNAVNADVISLINDGYMQDYVADNKTIIAAGAYTVTINLVNAKLASTSEGALYQKVKVGESFKPVTLDILGNYKTASFDGTYFNFNLSEDGTVATITPTETAVLYSNQYYIEVVAVIPHKHNDITFTALNSDDVYNSFINGGNYYLTSDVDWAINDSGFTVMNNLSICLNGYRITIRGMYPQIMVANDATLRIFDCNESGNGNGSIWFYREYVSDTSSIYNTSAINIGYGLLEIYGGTFRCTYDNHVIGGINVGGMSYDSVNWVYGNIAVYGGNLKNFLNSDGYCIRGNSANNNIKISGGTLGNVYVKSAIEADGYDGNALSVYYDGISNGVTVLKNSTVDKLNLLNDGYYAKQSGSYVIAVPPKTVTVTLEHATVTDSALLTQMVGGRITDIVITAEDGYVLPATLDIGYGLTYTLAPDGLTATISGEPTADTTITVTCEVADSRTTVDIPLAGSKDYTGETLISDLVDTELYTVTTNAGGIVAGEYDVVLTLKDNTSYRWATGDADDAVRTIKFVINKATNAWTTELDIADWTYGTTASDPVAEAKFGTVVFTYATAQNGSYNNVKPVNAGTYWVKATVEGTENYTALTDTKSFVIATVKVAKPVADTTVFTYDGTEKIYTVATNAAYAVTNDKRTNAGSQTVTVALNDKDNYEWTDGTTTDVTFDFVIAKAVVDVPSAGSKEYTGSLLQSDITDTADYTVTKNDGGTSVGYYDVVVELIDNGNYKWNDDGEDVAERTIQFRITKKLNHFTIELSMDNWTYGETAKEPSATALIGTVVFTYSNEENGTYSDTKPSAAGTYWVKAAVTETEDYEPLEAKKSFTIYTVKVNEPAKDTSVFSYNGAEQTYVVAANDAYTVSGNKQTNAGNHTVTIALIDKSNYEWATAGNSDDLTYAFNIGKIDYDMSGITFENGTAEYDGQAHSLTISGTLPTGLDGITVTVSYTGSATSVSQGAVTVTATFATDSVNYNVPEVKTATITIAQVTNAWTTSLDMAGWTYENTASNPVAEAKFGTVVFTYSTAQDGTYSNVKPVNAGTYWVKATVEGTENYTALTDTKSFVIATVKVAKPVVDTTVFTYDGTEKNYTVAANDAYTVSGNKQTNAGNHTVTIALIDKNNYEWADNTMADVEFTFTINKAQIAKPEADSTVFTYNKAEQTYMVAVNALYTVSNDKRTNAGSQTVTVVLIDADNYEWEDGTTADVEFTFTINKAVYDMSNVTFADKSIKADGNAQNIVIGGTLPEGVTVRYEGNGKTEPGVYTVTAIFTGDADNYEAIANKTATLTVLSAGMSESVPGNDTDKPDAIIESDNGLDPNLELVVGEITTKESVNKVIKKNEVIVKAYEVTLKSDGVVVQPDGTLTVKLLLPETLRGKKFRIISSENGENLQETEYTIEGDYVVFTTDRIAEFSFVSERDDASSLLWLIILLSILLLLEILLAIYKINKDRKDNREIKNHYAIAPFVLAAAFPQAQVTAVIVLAILNVICGAYDAYLYLRRKREPEEKLEDTSEDD